jgi:hypothetical protein
MLLGDDMVPHTAMCRVVGTLSSHGFQCLVTKAEGLLLQGHSTLMACYYAFQRQKELSCMPKLGVDGLPILDIVYPGSIRFPSNKLWRMLGYISSYPIH